MGQICARGIIQVMYNIVSLFHSLCFKWSYSKVIPQKRFPLKFLQSFWKSSDQTLHGFRIQYCSKGETTQQNNLSCHQGYQLKQSLCNRSSCFVFNKKLFIMFSHKKCKFWLIVTCIFIQNLSTHLDINKKELLTQAFSHTIFSSTLKCTRK